MEHIVSVPEGATHYHKEARLYYRDAIGGLEFFDPAGNKKWLLSTAPPSVLKECVRIAFTVSASDEVTAVSILTAGIGHIGDRASERDTDAERSMATTVKAFNAMYGTELTETQGWMFMVFLKASRAKGGDFRLDDYEDMASYSALAGECHAKVHQ
ncbi:hypothetical protein NVP1238A_50 [Vibrio phage 1.238.A._10N.261.52.F10]|uniref:DUF6378 domain-containing protein n=1 Tax=Vibrio phage 1.238.A._10N.261.52.F10 TaxID=1881231 RepID=A0A2I7RUI7_9CAUD|nr:phosphofructokinase [Vibrio phage 1.238.A._10N.261.52.F10]AUR97299.1 hypothetical protein NVP1238A_50 [Vibrio phage 1.238.A._10N.261.52.F10]AUR97393.1 hypothetical protein NVP1238B_51 [Vibrio phage 1.238.B._10N.261.52.F10]